MAPEALKHNCPQCGGPVTVAEGAAYAHCQYCGSEAFVDLSGALLYQVIKPTIGRSRAMRIVQTAAADAGWPDLKVARIELVYQPVWELELTDGSRLRISARPGPDGRFGLVDLPGGERAFVQPSARDRSASWLEPELAPESVAEVAARTTGRPVSVKAIRLVHHPVYSGYTTLEEARYEVHLDALSGKLLDAAWPVSPSFQGRNHAWTATGVMVLAALFIPLPWSLVAVAIVGALAVRSLMKRGTPQAKAAA